VAVSLSGLAGYLGRTDDASRVLAHVAQRMCHQPYHIFDSRILAPNVGIGRLSIGVFNRAAQPAMNGAANVAVWLCGEFYHQAERRAEMIRQGELCADADDCELALRVYLRDGVIGLTQLDGAFLIAAWDARIGELVLVNDRFGLYPHYYAHHGQTLTFAPEIKGVLCAPTIPRTVNRVAIAEYVRFQQLLGNKTWFEDVQMLPPASVIHYVPADDTLKLTQYWDWDQIGSLPDISFDDAVVETSRLFQRAIDAMIAGTSRVGIYLSGGLDGRAILGFIGGRVPVTTINFGHADCRDVVYAAELARRAKSSHHWFPMNDGKWVRECVDAHFELTEGMHSWIHMHGIHTLADARTWMDVNLSGWDGGSVLGGLAVLGDFAADEFFKNPHPEMLLTQKMYEAFCYDITWRGVNESETACLFGGHGDASLRHLAFESFREEFARTRHYAPERRGAFFFIAQHNRRSTQNMIVMGRSALEQRCPYFDYDLISFLYALPKRVRSSDHLQHEVITRRMPHLATVPCDKDDYLPHTNPLVHRSHKFVQRSKYWINRHMHPIFTVRPRLYADYENYLRTDLREWAESILFDERTQARGVFDPTAVRTLWEHHLSGTELWTIGKVAPLITLEMVFRNLVDEG
jgi:asparagine synthase (glutamine-hydrolysing)